MLAILSENSMASNGTGWPSISTMFAQMQIANGSAARHRPRHDAATMSRRARARPARVASASVTAGSSRSPCSRKLAYVGGDGSLVILRPEKPLTAARLSW